VEHSEYSGHVEPGGPAIRRVADVDGARVEVRKLSVGRMDNNVYILRDIATDKALIIDAADDARRILAEVDGLDVVGIVTTHGHGDHWQALDEVAGATGATTYLHPGDAHMVSRRADEPVSDGMEVPFGAARVQLYHTAGHTPGSVCVLLGDRHLFTGDTLFPGGPGNTFGDDVAFRTIMTSLRERLFALDDETWVYPGHGDDTTIGAERPQLDAWEERGW
jgi:glyoxylase-like metal-dependent hydrolase (beta-lactamase superfamily II)